MSINVHIIQARFRCLRFSLAQTKFERIVIAPPKLRSFRSSLSMRFYRKFNQTIPRFSHAKKCAHNNVSCSRPAVSAIYANDKAVRATAERAKHDQVGAKKIFDYALQTRMCVNGPLIIIQVQ